MTNKFTLLVIIVALVALVIGVAAYLTPGPTAQGGEAACTALTEAKANATNARAQQAIQEAIDRNCPDIGQNCAADLGLDPNLWQGNCEPTVEWQTAEAAFTFEPSPTCGGGTCYVWGL